MATLGIGQLTAVEVSPLEYVSIAADAGLDAVSLFIWQAGAQTSFPLTTREMSAEMLKIIRASGMRVANVECFMLTPKTEVEKFRPAIEFGAELGARSATVLLYDADESRVFDNLSRLSELTAAAGLRVGIEFMPFTPKWKNLKETAALVQQLARPNLGICIDMLHLIRSGGTPADVAAIDPAMIAYAQLCDSNDLTANENYFEEAGISRLAPGEGKFPLQEFLQALPAGTPLELEVPRKPDVPARERVRDIVVRTRRQLELAGI